MKCPHCHKDFTPPAPPEDLFALKYMVTKGWLFAGTLADEKWKTDRELVSWLERRWIEMHPQLGFRITPAGRVACQNDPCADTARK